MKKELETTYDPGAIEERLYQKWLDNKYFHAEVDETKQPYTIVIPPPNITGKLHMGHALDETLQDILIRFRRNREGRSWKREVLRTCLGLERRIWWNDHRTDEETWILL